METVTAIAEKKEKEKENESSPWRQALKKIKKNKMALVGLYALIFMFYFVLSVRSFHHMHQGKYKLR